MIHESLLVTLFVIVLEVNNHLKIRHNYLASSYHNGIISGFMLISTYLETVASTGRTVSDYPDFNF